MYSPALALAGAVFVTARSALRATVVFAVELSLALVGSVGDWAESEAVFEIEATVEEGLIWARIRTVFEAPAAIAPRAVEPLQLAPRLGSQAPLESTQKVAPWSSLERVSVRVALVPFEGPLLETAIT